MAYQVLARKYRPQRFADVAGQEHVTVTLMNALQQGRIAHGYIFSGHRGIGKTTIARILAMALNCRNAIGSEARQTAEPCEVCESCTEIRAGNAVDVIEIDAATNRGIDEIRELRDAARYRPARDRYKIYILDEAHQITDAAFNALLKTLEEPPDHVVFMMATTQPEDIPQTVRSRCQHFSFHAVKMADILKELRGIAAQEGVEADDAALGLLAEAGDGSMRDALSIMDQAIASAPMEGGHAVLSAAQIRELMGTVSNAGFERLLEAVDGGRSAEVMTLANELLDTGNSPSQLARQCVKYLRNVLMAKIAGVSMDAGATNGSGAEILQISPEERRRAARSAALFTEEELTRNLQVMLRTFDELGYRQEPRLHFELGLLKLVHLRRLLPVEELLSGLPGAGRRAEAVSAGAGTPARLTTTGQGASRQVGEERTGAAEAGTDTSARPNETRQNETRPGFSPFARVPGRYGDGGGTLARLEASAAAAVRREEPRGAAVEVADPVVRIAAGPTGPVGPTVATREPVAAILPEPTKASDLGSNGTASPADVDFAAAQPASSPAGKSGVAEHGREDVAATLTVATDAATGTGLGAQETARASEAVERGREAVATAAAADGERAAELQGAAVEALLRAKQTSASEAMEEAEWTVRDGSLRVQTTLSKTMLPMVLTQEADRVARAAVWAAGGDGLAIEWLPATATATATEERKGTGKRPARSGSAQARAEQHPMVKQAQQLFDAEIRKVIDLSDGK